MVEWKLGLPFFVAGSPGKWRRNSAANEVASSKRVENIAIVDVGMQEQGPSNT